MDTAVLSRYEIDIQDIEYLRHGDKPLLARVIKAAGRRPVSSRYRFAWRCMV